MCMDEAMLSLEKAAWSFRMLPSGVVVPKSTPGDQSPELPAYRIKAAAASDIVHLPFSHLSRRYRTFGCGQRRDMFAPWFLSILLLLCLLIFLSGLFTNLGNVRHPSEIL